MTGGGGLALEANDTYTGGTTVNGGALDILAGGALGKGTLTLNDVADFFLNGEFTLANAISIAGGPDLFVGTGDTATISGAIGNDGASTGGLVVSQETGEDGTLVLAGANTFTGGATVDSGATLSVSNNSALGSGEVTLDSSATLALTGSSLTLTGVFSQGAGSTTTIATGDLLTLSGGASLRGTTSGAGKLALAGGSATIDSGAALSVSHWSISGAGTDVTLGEALTYTGSFSEAANDTFVLSGGNLLLNGADTFSGGTVDGSKLLETEGTTAVSGLTIGGTAEWENTKTVTQSGGTVTIGDASGDKAFLDNTAKATYDIAGAGAIARGSSTTSYITTPASSRRRAERARARSRRT